jgi:L-ribulose-5-phosphate 3-epimerase
MKHLRKRLKIGTMDTVFRLEGKPEALPLAKRLGLAAVQVTLGKSKDGQTLPLQDAQLQQEFLSASDRYHIPIDATYLDMLHKNCLKNDPLGRTWLEKGIEITKKLRAEVLMAVFFNRCALTSRAELDYVIGVFRDFVPQAERAGIIMGFENMLSVEDNCYACDRVGSKAFKIWYDVGNPTYVGRDAAKEIRILGRDRICQFHFKDKAYLGEGHVDFPAILRAIDDIGFEGYANLETESPSGDVVADTIRNLNYLQRLMGLPLTGASPSADSSPWAGAVFA